MDIGEWPLRCTMSTDMGSRKHPISCSTPFYWYVFVVIGCCVCVLQRRIFLHFYEYNDEHQYSSTPLDWPLGQTNLVYWIHPLTDVRYGGSCLCRPTGCYLRSDLCLQRKEKFVITISYNYLQRCQNTSSCIVVLDGLGCFIQYSVWNAICDGSQVHYIKLTMLQTIVTSWT